MQLLHKAVEGWLQQVAIAIEQLELEEVFACFERFEPAIGPIEHHTAAIELSRSRHCSSPSRRCCRRINKAS